MVDVARHPLADHPLSSLAPRPVSRPGTPKGMLHGSLSAAGTPNVRDGTPRADKKLEFPAELQEFTKNPIKFVPYTPKKEGGAKGLVPINGPGANGANGINGVVKSKMSYSYGGEPEPPAKRQRTHSTSTSTTTACQPFTGPEAALDLYTAPLNHRWTPADRQVARRAGLTNFGNSCFLNSVLQVWMHTPALVNLLDGHPDPVDSLSSQELVGKESLFGLLKQYRNLSRTSQHFKPGELLQNIKRIGKSLSKVNQEDAHEFMRYGIDKLQKEELARLHKQKAPHDIRETTWVHKIWGGRLRSRVHCKNCGHNSDTIDTLMDLSLDLHGATSLNGCLAAFTRIEELRGRNKYKCGKCKQLVEATKQFMIVKAPPVLSIHLKRFNPLGGKIKRSITYDAEIDLERSKAVEPGTNHKYELFGVTVHQGSGPHFGHYYSLIKSAHGKWYEMNDTSVSPISLASVLQQKDAYILHYVVKPGGVLDDIRAGRLLANGKTANGAADATFFGDSSPHKSNGLPQRASMKPAAPAMSPQISGSIPRLATSSPGVSLKRKQPESEDEEARKVSPEPSRPMSASPSKRERREMKKKSKLGIVQSNTFYGLPAAGSSGKRSGPPSSPDAPAPWNGAFDARAEERTQRDARVQRMKSKYINKSNVSPYTASQSQKKKKKSGQHARAKFSGY